MPNHQRTLANKVRSMAFQGGSTLSVGPTTPGSLSKWKSVVDLKRENGHIVIEPESRINIFHVLVEIMRGILEGLVGYCCRQGRQKLRDGSQYLM